MGRHRRSVQSIQGMIITENTKRVVMIIGGSRGIGLAVGKEYAKQGDRVVISGRNDTRSLEDALASLREVSTVCGCFPVPSS